MSLPPCISTRFVWHGTRPTPRYVLVLPAGVTLSVRQHALLSVWQGQSCHATPQFCHTPRAAVCACCRGCRCCGKTSQTAKIFTFVPEFCSQSRRSLSRNLHCRPILRAGISLHSAQRQTVRGAIPSHFATAAVVRSGS